MDGTVVVRSGVTDIGAGQVSALGQIAVEVLGVTLDNVVVYNSDSAVTPLAGTTTATRALYMTGNAVKQAAEGVRARLVERAAQAFGVEPGEVDMGDNEVFVVDNPAKSMPVVDLVRLCGSEGIHRSELAMFRAPFTDFLDPETGQGQAHPDYAYGAHAVEVSVDVDTGEVEVLKSVAAHDVGQCINPAAVEGQIQGGAQNGQGYALSEEMLYEEGAAHHPVVQRVPDADLHGHAEGRVHHPRIPQRRRTLRCQGHRRAGDDCRGAGHRQRRGRRDRGARVRDADHAPSGSSGR